MPVMIKPREAAELRQSLVRLLPGYKWTVHKNGSATGIQSSGFNRISTISVVRDAHGRFYSKIAGYGTRAKWLAHGFGATLPRAIRTMQDSLEHAALAYTGLAARMKDARTGAEES